SGDDFRAVCKAAKRIRDLLEKRGLTAYVKTTGSRGLHVMAALDGKKDYGEIRAFAQGIAVQLVQGDPDHLTSEIRKTNRVGRIFVDIARNAYAQTAAP